METQTLQEKDAILVETSSQQYIAPQDSSSETLEQKASSSGLEIAVLSKDERKELSQLREYAARITKRNPGLGPVAADCARSLVDASFSPALAKEVIDVVYTPNALRGQGNKVKFFTEAVQRHYGESYLEHVAQDPRFFRRFVQELHEVTEMREELNGEGYGMSFQEAVFLSDADTNTERFYALASQIQEKTGETREYVVKHMIVQAAKKALEVRHDISSVLEEMGYIERDYVLEDAAEDDTTEEHAA